MRRVCVTMRGTRVSRQCLCVGTGSKTHKSTPVPTFISRMNCARITFILLTSTDYRGTKCLYVERSRSVRVWTRTVSYSCVGRASKVRGILYRICSYASMCGICQWFVSDCKWYVRCSYRDFCPRHPKTLVNFSTHKHSQTQSMRDLWVFRARSAVWLSLKMICILALTCVLHSFDVLHI